MKLESIDVPKKEFFTFDESAHLFNLDEPKRLVEIVCSISEK